MEMKKLLLTIVMAVAITNVFGATSYTWVGGTSTWNTPTNWNPNGTPGTNDDVTINSATPITITLGNATLVNSLTVTGGSTISFAGAFAFTINSGLNFSGGTKISLTTQAAFTLGNGTATFSLSGNNVSNYFTATSGNGYLAINNNTTGSIDLFVDPATTWYNFVIQKGTTVLKSNCITNRLGLSSLNNQKLVLDANVAFTLNGTGSSSLGLNTAGAAGYVDASASGSKFTFMGNGNAGASVFAGTNRIFADGATVNNLEMNTTSVVLSPNTALKVNTLTLTAGNINNTSNNITVLNGGTIIRANQNALLAAAPIYGLVSTDKVNIQYNTTCTTGNELFGTLGSIGTVTVNNGVTATLSNSSITSIAISGTLTGFSTPTVTIPAPANGVQATATAVVTGTAPNKTLLSILITNPGYGYTSAPAITLSENNAAVTCTPSINSQTGTAVIDALNIGGGASGIVTYPNTSAKVMTLSVKDLTVNAGATLTCGTQTNNVVHLLNVGGNITNNGTFTPINTAGAKVVDVTMNGTTAQAINSAITFNGLTIANTTNPVSVGAALNTTNLTINSGAVLNMQSNVLSTVTTTNGTGKLQTQATTAAIPSGKTWNFNVEYNNPSGGQSVITGTYTGGLTMSNTNGVNTAGGNLTIGNILTLNSGSTFLLPSPNSISSGTGFTGSTGAGTLQIGDQNNVSYKIPTGLTWSGTVEYVFAGNNRIVPGNYNNLTVDDGTLRTINWGNSASETGTIAIAGTLTTASTSYTINQATIEFNGTNQSMPRISVYNLKLSGTGTTFPATYLYIANNFDPGSITSASQGTISFNGTGNQTIPEFGYNALAINNTVGATINNSLSVPSLTINALGILNIDAGKHLTVSTSMTNNGTLNLRSTETDGTATIITPATIGGTTGTTNVEQYLGTTRNWYISSPVSNAKAPAGFTYYQRDVAGSSWTSQPFAAASTFEKGRGYIAMPGATGATMTFTTETGGTLNTGNVDVTLSAAGFNLIGNPYPSHLTWTPAFVDDAANAAKIDPTIWVRTNSGASNTGGWSFLTYNAHSGEAAPSGSILTGGVIPPMQAFWVKAKVASTLTLDNKLTRSHQSSNPLKAPASKNNERQRVRLQINNGTTTDEALIYFDGAASNDFDPFDSPKFADSNSVTQIYTTAGTEKLVINGMNSIPLNQPVALGLVPGNAALFSIRANEISNIPADVKVILKDNVTQVETDLTDGSAVYQFSAETTNPDRFSVIFRSSSTTTALNNNNVSATQIYWNNEQGLTFKTNDEKLVGSTLTVYNSLGQQLLSKKIAGTTMNINISFAPDMYFVKINNVTTKVIVK